jgi:hypothetical protein
LYYLRDYPRWNRLDSTFGEEATLALLTGFVAPSLNIVRGNITFIAIEELLPSWRSTFLLITNQLSLNTKSSKSSPLITIIVVDA